MRLEQIVLATLSYSDIFDYPLKLEELHSNLMFHKIPVAKLKLTVEKLLGKGIILKFGNYYQLPKQVNLAKKRRLREKFAVKKFKKAKLAARILSFIPTVKLIGVSGAAAVANTPLGDDIDFFIICAKNRLWTTRFFANLFLDFFRLRRKPDDKKVADKICLNLFMTEDILRLGPADIYLAHEILQMKPVFVRGDTYSKFIKVNDWVFEFLPNWDINVKLKTKNVKLKTPKNILIFNFLLSTFENFLKKLQLKLMEKRRTTEKISDTKLFFHPADVHQQVLTKFKNKLKKLKIPLDKVL